MNRINQKKKKNINTNNIIKTNITKDNNKSSSNSIINSSNNNSNNNISNISNSNSINNNNSHNKLLCPYCGGENTNRNGHKYNRQRYICRDCGKSFSDGDNRIKRDVRLKELALLLYSNNVSIKSIQRVINTLYNTNVCYTLIMKWINATAKLLEFRNEKEKTNTTNTEKQTINILEMDELWSYYTTKDKETNRNFKKNSKYGLLLTETEIKLFHLR